MKRGFIVNTSFTSSTIIKWTESIFQNVGFTGGHDLCVYSASGGRDQVMGKIGTHRGSQNTKVALPLSLVWLHILHSSFLLKCILMISGSGSAICKGVALCDIAVQRSGYPYKTVWLEPSGQTLTRLAEEEF